MINNFSIFTVNLNFDGSFVGGRGVETKFLPFQNIEEWKLSMPLHLLPSLFDYESLKQD